MSTSKVLALGCAAALWAVGCGPPASVTGLHGGCPASGCASGQTCLSYCGLSCGAGSIQTCEIVCAGDLDCPPGLHCAAVADGPPGKTCQ